MLWVNAVAFVADVWVLTSYAWMVKHQRARPFHWANSIGAIPLAASEALVGAWPAFCITISFGIIGAVALARGT